MAAAYASAVVSAKNGGWTATCKDQGFAVAGPGDGLCFNSTEVGARVID